MSWLGALQFASWKSIPFYAEAVEVHAGRLTAVHTYPFRDRNPVWVEDIGLGPRSHRITGFLVGDTIAIQQAALLAAMQTPGQGNLIHPTLGFLTGSVVGGCTFSLRKDRGRYIEVQFEFVENLMQAPYPTADASTSDAVGDAAKDSRDAASSIFDKLNFGSFPLTFNI